MKIAFRSALALGYGAARVMRNTVFAFGVGIIAAGAAFAADVPRIVALGDSLTAGYGLPASDGFVPQLQAWLDANGAVAQVVNAGVSGDTTAGGAARLAWSLDGGAQALIVNLGGNDMLRGLDPSVARANLTQILDGARAQGLPVLLVGMIAPGNYGVAYKAQFDAIYPDLAAQFGVLLVPAFFAPIAGADGGIDLAFMQSDGIHPDAGGVARIVEAMGPKVLELLELTK
ncbi:arylesterase [Pseudorhodobacter antarcticus]|nr:arylesterase [Pseudorhodobacter antarcticus]